MAPRGPPGSRRTLAVPRPPGGRGAAPRVRCRPGRVGGGGGAARAAAPGRPGGSSADTRRERLRGRSGPGATEGPRGPGWSARGRVPPPSHAVGPRPAPHTPVRSVTLTSRSRSPCPRLTRPSPRGPPLTRPDPHLTQPSPHTAGRPARPPPRAWKGPARPLGDPLQQVLSAPAACLPRGSAPGSVLGCRVPGRGLAVPPTPGLSVKPLRAVCPPHWFGAEG